MLKADDDVYVSVHNLLSALHSTRKSRDNFILGSVVDFSVPGTNFVHNDVPPGVVMEFP